MLWLWHRPAAAALIQPIAWELPYASGVALKKINKKINKKKFYMQLMMKVNCFQMGTPADY